MSVVSLDLEGAVLDHAVVIKVLRAIQAEPCDQIVIMNVNTQSPFAKGEIALLIEQLSK